MTYCCGILVRDGLVMIADTRTNAGLDSVSTFRKLHVFGVPGQRIMALASSGNLSLSQSVVSTLTEGILNTETDEPETLLNAPTMFQAAQRIGQGIRQVQKLEGAALEAADVKFDVSFLFAGQIKGGKLRLFMIYGAGNFIECSVDSPYLQIGAVHRAFDEVAGAVDHEQAQLLALDLAGEQERDVELHVGGLERVALELVHLPDRLAHALRRLEHG